MAHKLDIFKTLERIDRKDRKFWDSLTEEERKGFTPFVVIQWLTGTKDPAQIYFLNEMVNPFIFEFGKHPELLYDLMLICSTSKKCYQWIKKKKTVKFPKSIDVIKRYFGYSSAHSKDTLKCFSDSDIFEMAEELGYQKEELKILKKETNEINII